MSATDDEEALNNGLFDIAIATIFAREVLEGALIIGNYRTVILKTQGENITEERQKEQLRAVTLSAVGATVVAIIVIAAVAIPLAVLSSELDNTTVEIIEGVAKLVGAIAILQLSIKIPVWLGLYKKIPLIPWRKYLAKYSNGRYQPKKRTRSIGLTLAEIRFNVAWNIWREVAECGAFLIPFFLQGTLRAIPLSAALGCVISFVLGILIYIANNRLTNKTWLAIMMSGTMLMLATGLFTMGCHEFEEVWGLTRIIWQIEGEGWNDKSLPMTVFRPFGYSSTRTLLQICCFWSYLLLGLSLHAIKFRNTRVYLKKLEERNARRDAARERNPTIGSLGSFSEHELDSVWSWDL